MDITSQDIASPRAPVLVATPDTAARDTVTAILADDGGEVIWAANGRVALEIVRSQPLPLLVSDWDLLEITGLEFCQWVRAEPEGRNPFILMLLPQATPEHMAEALAAGVDDFAAKPLRPVEVKARLGTARRAMGVQARDLMVLSAARLADAREPETAGHLQRMRLYARLLAEELTASRTAGPLPQDFADLMHSAVAAHDLGKAGLPAEPPERAQPSGPREARAMVNHTTIGASSLDEALAQNPHLPYLRVARDIMLTHHERYDGGGYPQGLKGPSIPLSGRIAAVCDAYDRLTHPPAPATALPHSTAREAILGAAGTRFDPLVVNAFRNVEHGFAAVAAQLAME